MTPIAPTWNVSARFPKSVLRGGAARRHRIWDPVFRQLTRRPGTWALLSTEGSAAAARFRVRSLTDYLHSSRPLTHQAYELRRLDERVLGRYVPPSRRNPEP